jgi:hypothetical protein
MLFGGNPSFVEKSAESYWINCIVYSHSQFDINPAKEQSAVFAYNIKSRQSLTLALKEINNKEGKNSIIVFWSKHKKGDDGALKNFNIR